MSKFKVGDRVTVKPLDEIREWECQHGVQVPWAFPSEMSVYCGKTFTVSTVERDWWAGLHDVQSRYRLIEVGYSWSDPMLDLEDINR